MEGAGRGREPLAATGDVVREAEDDVRSTGGDAREQALGSRGVLGGVAAGQMERAAKVPGQKGVDGRRLREGEVAAAKKPDGIEGAAGGFERAEDLNGGVVRLGSKDGAGKEAAKLVERTPEGYGLTGEVQCGEFVERVFPSLADLVLEAGLFPGRPADRVKGRADAFGPGKIRARNGLAHGCGGVIEGAEGGGEARGAFGLRHLAKKVGKRDFGAEMPDFSRACCVEADARTTLASVAACGDSGREQKAGDGGRGQVVLSPGEQVERNGDRGRLVEGHAQRKLVGRVLGGTGYVVELGSEGCRGRCARATRVRLGSRAQ